MQSTLPSFEVFKQCYKVERGTANPQVMTNPFWTFMAKCREGSSSVRYEYKTAGHDLAFLDDNDERYAAPGSHPVYSQQRFGCAVVKLPNRDKIRIAGEHEDWYDPDFCVYNDITRVTKDGEVTIYGYPTDVFPPTDNHAATYVSKCNAIYIIGGWQKNLPVTETPVYKLDVKIFAITEVATTGTKPGLIRYHESLLADDSHLVIRGGRIENENKTPAFDRANHDVYELNLDTCVWSVRNKY